MYPADGAFRATPAAWTIARTLAASTVTTTVSTSARCWYLLRRRLHVPGLPSPRLTAQSNRRPGNAPSVHVLANRQQSGQPSGQSLKAGPLCQFAASPVRTSRRRQTRVTGTTSHADGYDPKWPLRSASVPGRTLTTLLVVDRSPGYRARDVTLSGPRSHYLMRTRRAERRHGTGKETTRMCAAGGWRHGPGLSRTVLEFVGCYAGHGPRECQPWLRWSWS